MKESNQIRKFLIDSADTRGHWVRLDSAWRTACERIDYPEVVRQILGEAFAAAALMAATIKYDGKLTMQVRGNGPVHLLLVQVSSDGDMRGLARWTSLPESETVAAAFGVDAQMSITITTSNQPYQGTVLLDGERLSDALSAYFRDSEQLPTELFLAVSKDQVTGLLLQKVPGNAIDQDGWDRARQLALTVDNEELQTLAPEKLLHRLFHQETVHLYQPQTVRYACSCARERTDNMIRGLGQEEAVSILEEEGAIEVTCEFCAEVYRYDSVDVGVLFAPVAKLVDSDIETVQ